MFKEEFKRALNWKKVLIFIFILLIIQGLGPFEYYKRLAWVSKLDVDTLNIMGVYNKYVNLTKANFYYMLLLPITVSILYGTSFINDYKKGFIKFIDTRISHRRYQISKFFVNGIIGGLSACIPTMIFFLILSIIYGQTSNEGVIGMYREVFLKSPATYMVIFFSLQFAFGFTYSTVALGVSSVIKNEVVTLLSPALFYFVLEYVKRSFKLPNIFSSAITNKFWLVVDGVKTYEIIINLLLITLIFGTIFFYFSRKEALYE